MKTSKTNNRLVCLIYQLLRDEILPGIMEKIVTELENPEIKEIIKSNGYLAEYAKEIVERLNQ